jgi:hypothetical protein
MLLQAINCSSDMQRTAHMNGYWVMNLLFFQPIHQITNTPNEIQFYDMYQTAACFDTGVQSSGSVRTKEQQSIPPIDFVGN